MVKRKVDAVHYAKHVISKTWQLRFTFLRQLWERFYEKEIRVRQKDTKWWNLLLLQQKLFSKTSKLSIAQKCIVCNQPVPKRTMKYCSQECRQSVKRNRNCNAQIATKHFTQHQQEQFIVRGNVQTKHTANA